MSTTQRTLTFLLLLLLLAGCSPTVAPPTVGPDQVPSAVPPSPKVEPSAQPSSPTAGPTLTQALIVLEQPAAGAEVSSPVTVRGVVAVVPFESTLRGRVYDSAGQVVGEGPIMVQGSMGDPGPVPFEGQIAFSGGGASRGRVEVAELSPKDGTPIASALVDVVLAGSAAAIEVPAAGISATLPLHIMARVGRPGDLVVAVLRWQDGAEITPEDFNALLAVLQRRIPAWS